MGEDEDGQENFTASYKSRSWMGQAVRVKSRDARTNTV